MIGLVVVSHSATLAEGVVELARGMVGDAVPIAAAGGLDEPGVLGTDAMRVMSAIEQVADGTRGVLVLMDMGSALLSAEMALDFLPPELRENVRLCPAPLVEGTVAAAVEAKGGASLDEAYAAARTALDAKLQQLGEAAAPPPAPPVLPAAPEQRITLTVPNRLGLHARPAARLVAIARRFDAQITLHNPASGRNANAASFNALMLLGAVGGQSLNVSASGPDASPALAAVQAFAGDNFGDPADSAVPAIAAPAIPPTPAHAGLRGLPASPGIAVGKAAPHRPTLAPLPTHSAADPQAEIDHLKAAINRARVQIEAQRSQAERQSGAEAATIFAAHLAFLDDPDIVETARQQVTHQHANAAAAWKAATDAVIAGYHALDSAYLQARAADAEALQTQVLAELIGSATAPPLTEPAILIARDLTPAEVGALDPGTALAVVTAEGSPTSHAAILARTLGIPMLVGVGASILSIAAGTLLAVDGETGELVLQPDAETQARFARAESKYRARQETALRHSAAPAVTIDGQRVEVLANVGGAADTRHAVELGADGVGVLRTEFLFMQRQTAPSADEQYAAYRSIAQALHGRPLVIRTLDAGGDKPLPYLPQRHEENPFLGLRAVRLCLANPDFFRAQLQAIVRVADEFPVRVMFPMIATPDEFRAAKALLVACGQPRNPVQTGIMVEIPSAVELAEHFAPEVDFFSIGTNDLTQYAFAAERGSPDMAYLSDALHPVVLRMIERVVAAAHAYRRPVAVCGELASDPAAIPILLGLGVDELSMNPAAIPQAKAVVRGVRLADAGALAQAALRQESAAQVRRLAAEYPSEP